MNRYIITDIKRDKHPNWSPINEIDAKVLLGYCYGRYEFTRNNENISIFDKLEITKDLLSSLFVCGRNLDEIKLVSEIFISIVIDSFGRKNDKKLLCTYLEDACLMLIKFNLNINQSDFTIYLDKFIQKWKPSDKFDELDKNILLLYLDIFLNNKITRKKELKKILREDQSSQKPYIALIDEDGNVLMDELDKMNISCIERASNNLYGSKNFLARTLLFRDMGNHFIFSGIRDMAMKIGIPVRLPLEETNFFYPPDWS